MSPLGARIHWIRSQKRMTLKQLAKATGLTISFLSQVERGATSPSIDSLRRIGRAFGLSIGRLLDDEPLQDRQMTLIRKAARRRIRLDTDGVSAETLAGGVMETTIEPRLVRLASGTTFRPTPGESAADAFGFVWQGALELAWEQGERVRLQRGDSIHIHPKRPYRLVNVGGTAAVLLWIVFGASAK